MKLLTALGALVFVFLMQPQFSSAQVTIDPNGFTGYLYVDQTYVCLAPGAGNSAPGPTLVTGLADGAHTISTVALPAIAPPWCTSSSVAVPSTPATQPAGLGNFVVSASFTLTNGVVSCSTSDGNGPAPAAPALECDGSTVMLKPIQVPLAFGGYAGYLSVNMTAVLGPPTDLLSSGRCNPLPENPLTGTRLTLYMGTYIVNFQSVGTDFTQACSPTVSNIIPFPVAFDATGGNWVPLTIQPDGSLATTTANLNGDHRQVICTATNGALGCTSGNPSVTINTYPVLIDPGQFTGCFVLWWRSSDVTGGICGDLTDPNSSSAVESYMLPVGVGLPINSGPGNFDYDLHSRGYANAFSFMIDPASYQIVNVSVPAAVQVSYKDATINGQTYASVPTVKFNTERMRLNPLSSNHFYRYMVNSYDCNATRNPLTAGVQCFYISDKAELEVIAGLSVSVQAYVADGPASTTHPVEDKAYLLQVPSCGQTLYAGKPDEEITVDFFAHSPGSCSGSVNVGPVPTVLIPPNPAPPAPTPPPPPVPAALRRPVP